MHVVHPIAATQFEYSPFSLSLEGPQIWIWNACKELGITLIASSPLGRGQARESSCVIARPLMLAETSTEGQNVDALSDTDVHKLINFPRFQKENV